MYAVCVMGWRKHTGNTISLFGDKRDDSSDRKRDREGHDDDDDAERGKRIRRARKQHGKFKLREVTWCSVEMDSNRVVGRNDMKMIKTISQKGEGETA